MGSLMVDLVQWLRDQLNDDEAAAEACLPLHLRVGRFRGAEVPRWRITKSGTGIIDEDGGTLRAQQIFPAEADHVIRHDPARVLREINAKRKLLAELLPEPTEPETDAELHARMAHPAFEYRTTEGPRKQWDDVDVGPVDEEGEPEPGWERNVDAGRGGWERWDYIEESYWRRRLPEGCERKPVIPRWLRLLALPYSDRDGYREEWRP